MGVSRGRAPAAGSSRPLRVLGRRGGQRARERSLFLQSSPGADASGFARRAGWERPNRSFVLGWWHNDASKRISAPSARSGARISGKANINLRKTLPLAGRRPCRFRASAALSTDLTGLRAANRRIQRRRARSRAVSRPKPGAAHRCPTRSLGVRRFLAARLLRRLGVTRRTRLLFRIWQPAHPAGALRGGAASGRVRALNNPTANARSVLDSADPTRNEITTHLHSF